jgi:hypothetical protein
VAIFLRQTSSGLFYAGPHRWVADPKIALDLRTVDEAVQVSKRMELSGVDVVACVGYPECEWMLRLHPGVGADKAALRFWKLATEELHRGLPPETKPPPVSRLPPRKRT